MIRHIALEDSLNTVLKEYNVNYAIISSYFPIEKKDNCYKIEIPFQMQAGARSKKMKGCFSNDPIFYYESPNDPAIPIIIYTYIFKI